MRFVLAVVGGVLALLCLGGIGITFVVYDDATKIDRGAPDTAVDNFLRAYLVKRDDAEAALYRCQSTGGLSQLDMYRTDIASREKRYSISIQVTWEGLTVAAAGTRATVDVVLTSAITDGSEQSPENWQFIVIDDGGWRVCGAAKVS
jgi:hypothetical protein